MYRVLIVHEGAVTPVVCVCVVARDAFAAQERLETYHPANTLNASIFNSCGDVRIDFLDPVPRAPCIPSPNANVALLIFKGKE